MTLVRRISRTTFAALEVPNYRRYIQGQSVSLIGTLDADDGLGVAGPAARSHSATCSGVIVALQTLPVLVLGPYGGVIADRVDKRRMMIALQAAMGLQALILGVLAVAGAQQLEIGCSRWPWPQRLRESGATAVHAGACRP